MSESATATEMERGIYSADHTPDYSHPEGAALYRHWLQWQQGADRIARGISDKLAVLMRAAPPEAYQPDTQLRVVRFGYGYAPSVDYRSQAPSPLTTLPPLPDWLQDIAERLPLEAVPDSASVNEYPPGGFIGPHVDSLAFGPEIAILSVGGGAAQFVLNPPIADRKWYHTITLELRDGDLLILSGAMRSHWKHEVKPVGDWRYSIVFRKFLK